MGLKEAFSYYGRFDGPKPIRLLAEDLVAERKKTMMQELKDMEDRLKRHITECKREIVKEIQAIFTDIKQPPKKEMRNAKF